MCTERGHSDTFMQLTAKLVKGNEIKYKYCTFIMGNTGVESAKFKPVLCGDYPNDKDLPSDMIPITGTQA